MALRSRPCFIPNFAPSVQNPKSPLSNRNTSICPARILPIKANIKRLRCVVCHIFIWIYLFISILGISKLFEMAVLRKILKFLWDLWSSIRLQEASGLPRCEMWFNCQTSDMTERYISNGSTVNMCTLDLSKAFDRTNHYALFIKLVQILTLIEFWFSVSVTCVNWKRHFSAFYSLTAGIQGGVLSPFYFSVFIDGVVDKVKSRSYQCWLLHICHLLQHFALYWWHPTDSDISFCASNITKCLWGGIISHWYVW